VAVVLVVAAVVAVVAAVVVVAVVIAVVVVVVVVVAGAVAAVSFIRFMPPYHPQTPFLLVFTSIGPFLCQSWPLEFLLSTASFVIRSYYLEGSNCHVLFRLLSIGINSRSVILPLLFLNHPLFFSYSRVPSILDNSAFIQ
jgi:hypothetical protein